MIRNYFIVALRNLRLNKNYTLINVLGLSIGITACIVIFLLITYELSFDKFHSKYNRIYRIVQEVNDGSAESFSAATPYPLTAAFRNDFPDIPLSTQLHFQHEVTLTKDDVKQKVKDVVFADSLFFEVFDFKTISGNPRVDLAQPGKVLLTESLADKIKAREGMSLRVDKIDVQVAGIVADPPANSHINFSMIVSMPSFTGDFLGGLPIDDWGMTARSFTYLVLPENTALHSLEEQLKPFVIKYLVPEDAKRKVYKLQSLADIHFSKGDNKNPGHVSSIDRSSLMFMAMLGAFILAIACINFVNLATVSSEKKSREIGIRKTLGAQQRQLAGYFLSETFLLTFLALLISLGATERLLYWLNDFLEKDIQLHFFSNLPLLLFLCVLLSVTTLMAGFYPALVLSRFSPTVVLRNKLWSLNSAGVSLRRALVVFQFLIAQMLIMGTLIIAEQMDFFRNKPLGFEKDAIVNVPIPNNSKANQDAWRVKLEANPNIRSVTFAMGAPVSDMDYYTDFFLTEKGREQSNYGGGIKSIDRHYFDTYGIELIAGRNFNENDENLAALDFPEDEQRHVIVINESAFKQLGFREASEVLGKMISTGLGVTGEVIGVVKDFHITSLHKEIVPVVFTIIPYFYYEAGIKIKTVGVSETLKYIESSWRAAYPDAYFEFEFLDAHLNSLYQNEEKTYTLLTMFAGVSIFVACLGLYGLIAFVTSQKQKEVGIRKVMGASTSSILLLFSKDFIKLVTISFVVATPTVWYTMSLWLNSFAYKVALHWSFFVIGFISTLFIVLATIAHRSIRTARLNPAVTLRIE